MFVLIVQQFESGENWFEVYSTQEKALDKLAAYSQEHEKLENCTVNEDWREMSVSVETEPGGDVLFFAQVFDANEGIDEGLPRPF